MYSTEPQYQAFAEEFNVGARSAFLRSAAAVPPEQHAAYRGELERSRIKTRDGDTQAAAFEAIAVSPEQRESFLDVKNLDFAAQDEIEGIEAKASFLRSAVAVSSEPKAQAAYRDELEESTILSRRFGVTQAAAFEAIAEFPEKRAFILDAENVDFAAQAAIKGPEAKRLFLTSTADVSSELEQQAAYHDELKGSTILSRDGDTQAAAFAAIAESPEQRESLLHAKNLDFAAQDEIKGPEAKARFLLSAAAVSSEPEQQTAYRDELRDSTILSRDSDTQEAAFAAIADSPEQRESFLHEKNLDFAAQDEIEGLVAKAWFLRSAAAVSSEPEQQTAYRDELRDSTILSRDGDTQAAAFGIIAHSPEQRESFLHEKNLDFAAQDEINGPDAKAMFLRSAAGVSSELHATYLDKLERSTILSRDGDTQVAAFGLIADSPEQRESFLDAENLDFASQDEIKGLPAKALFLSSAAAVSSEPEEQAAYRDELKGTTILSRDGDTQAAAFEAIAGSPEKRGAILHADNVAIADQLSEAPSRTGSPASRISGAHNRGSLQLFNKDSGDSLRVNFKGNDRPRFISSSGRARDTEWAERLPSAFPDTSTQSASEYVEDLGSGALRRTYLDDSGGSRYTPRAARTEPIHATGAQASYPIAHTKKLQKESDDLKKWKTFLRDTGDSLTLYSHGVDAFKTFALDSKDLRGIKSLTIEGSEDHPYDLRNVIDLGERLGEFPNLQTAKLRNCKINTLNIGALPPSLRIDLTDSIVPLPLQDRLKEQLGEANVTIESWPKQVEAYDKRLLTWSQFKPKEAVHEKRVKTYDDITNFLNGKNRQPLSLKGHNLHELPPDFYAMVAGKYPTSIDLSGNKLGVHANGKAKPFDISGFALMEKLEKVLLANNGITAVPGLGALKQHAHLKLIDLRGNPLAEIPEHVYSLPRQCEVILGAEKLSAIARAEMDIADSLNPDNKVYHDGATPSTRSRQRKLGEAEAYIEAVEHQIKVIERQSPAKAQRLQKYIAPQTQIQATGDRLEVIDTLFEQWEDTEREESKNPQLAATARYRRDFATTTKALFYGSISLLSVPKRPNVQSETGWNAVTKIAHGTMRIGAIGTSFAPPVSGAIKIADAVLSKISDYKFEKINQAVSQVLEPEEVEPFCNPFARGAALMTGHQLGLRTLQVQNAPKDPGKLSAVEREINAEVRREKESADGRAAETVLAMAFGDALGVPENEAAQHLRRMTTEQKVETALHYFCDRQGVPYKAHLNVYHPSLHEQSSNAVKGLTVAVLDTAQSTLTISDHFKMELAERTNYFKTELDKQDARIDEQDTEIAELRYQSREQREEFRKKLDYEKKKRWDMKGTMRTLLPVKYSDGEEEYINSKSAKDENPKDAVQLKRSGSTSSHESFKSAGEGTARSRAGTPAAQHAAALESGANYKGKAKEQKEHSRT